MKIDEARIKTINWLTNSTKCCHGERYLINLCAEHTPAWIEAEAQRRVDDAVRIAQFNSEWTPRLGDILPSMSARKIGETLIELGLRVYNDKSKSYHASHAALECDVACLIDEYGISKVFWHRETTRRIVEDGPSHDEVRHWRRLNDDKDRYEAELAAIESEVAMQYMTDYERQVEMYGYKWGEPQSTYDRIRRNCRKRAFTASKQEKAA